jgi:dTDP-4-dehydrorhamnose reductase
MKRLRLVVVGASGVIGGALLRLAQAEGANAVGTAMTRLRPGLVPFDMSRAPLRSVVPDLGPGDVVYLLAGYISPGWIFANQAAARHLNLDCTRRVVDETAAAGARLVFMSTDQVFDGATGGYTEPSPTQPSNLYGQLKTEVERHVLATEHGIVARTGWTVGWELGQHCAVVQCYDTLLKADARMAQDNLINVTDVVDIARGLLALAAAEPPGGRIYHLVNAPEISRADLAAAVKRDSRWGAAMEFERVLFASLAYSEPRPTRAFLRSDTRGALGLVFSPPENVIRRKVALIDRWRAERDVIVGAA